VTQTRISKVQEILQDGQSFYLTNLINIRYLCGFTGSNAALLISKSKAILATDSRYEIASSKQCFDVEIVIGRNLSELLIGKDQVQEIWFESVHLTVSQLSMLSKQFHKQKFVAKVGIIEEHRQVKDDAEIGSIRLACEISVAAWRKTLEQIKVGQSEREVRNLLEANMREYGADDIAFSSIVASGANSAIPHHEPSERELSNGDFLKIDFGAKLNGYHADCTRTVVLGKAADWQVEVYQALASAQAAGRNALNAQATYLGIEKVVNESLKASGHLEYFTHGLGHGVGLEIHENPFFGRKSQDKIKENTVLTIEPGIYLRDRGGVRIEDTVVVTSETYVNLTNLPYELIEI
jgi:Xaa-Pro aminopeptidase